LASVLIHISGGAFAKADEVLGEVQKHPLMSDNVKHRNEIHCCEARIALESGDFVRAEKVFRLIDKTLLPTYSVTRRGFYLAVELRIRLHQQANPAVIRQIVGELEQTHLLMRRLGAQDFEVHALCLGFRALGHAERGDALLKEYVEVHKRANWPLPQSVAEALSESGRKAVARRAARGVKHAGEESGRGYSAINN
jgi:hypothetical protein